MTRFLLIYYILFMFCCVLSAFYNDPLLIMFLFCGVFDIRMLQPPIVFLPYSLKFTAFCIVAVMFYIGFCCVTFMPRVRQLLEKENINWSSFYLWVVLSSIVMLPIKLFLGLEQFWQYKFYPICPLDLGTEKYAALVESTTFTIKILFIMSIYFSIHGVRLLLEFYFQNLSDHYLYCEKAFKLRRNWVIFIYEVMFKHLTIVYNFIVNIFYISDSAYKIDPFLKSTRLVIILLVFRYFIIILFAVFFLKNLVTVVGIYLLFFMIRKFIDRITNASKYLKSMPFHIFLTFHTGVMLSTTFLLNVYLFIIPI